VGLEQVGELGHVHPLSGTAGRDAVTRFVHELQRLRRLAGSPSLTCLAAVTDSHERPLPRSTVSDKLNGKSLPEWNFVASFVTACRAYAEAAGASLPAHMVDLDRWDTAHLQMLRAVDEGNAEQRMIMAARTEMSRRTSRIAPTSTPATVETMGVVPRQLPPAVRHFAGRTAECDQLTGLLDEAAATGAAMVIAAIDGTAGVGKTALAVYWAYQVADRFPDGQLYVNLRGFDSTGSPVDPTEAVGGLLDALQVPPGQVPVSLEARVALYRSVLSGRRIVLLLDNAVSAEQVRPLLPGSPGSLVLVTSRSRLTSLIANEGAHPLTLGLLSTGEARELLARRLGSDRIVAELPSADGIVARCSRLPLALVVVAARAATHPRFPLAVLESELRDIGSYLDAFDGGDASTDMRAVFSWSHQRLSQPAAQLFRLLGLHPGPDVSSGAAASLCGTTPEQVRPMLAELDRAHLVEEHSPGRFTSHDLLRAYGTELVERHNSQAERHAALHRMLDYYLSTAYSADRLLDPHREPIDVARPHDGVTPERPADRGQALAWFTAERPVLLTVVGQAAEAGYDLHAWQLAWALESFVSLGGHWQDWLDTQRTALEAANRLGDAGLQARAHHDLARACGRLCRYAEADTHLRQALALFIALNDRTGEADTHLLLAMVFGGLGRHRPALGHLRRALGLSRAADNAAGQAAALNLIGWTHALLDDPAKALRYCQRALDLHRELGNQHGEANAWTSLGYVNRSLGRHHQATSCYRQALDLFRQVGDRYHEADTLSHLGDIHHADGGEAAAREAWRGALTILERLGHADVDQVRAKLFPRLTALPQVSTQM
jgi:tetratricopeptide (TPR) repeat protein